MVLILITGGAILVNGKEGIDEMRQDVLKEIANIGSGHAATALAALLNRPITQSLPKIILVPLSEMSEKLGGAEKVSVGGLLQISGDFTGFLITFLDLEQADKVISMVQGKPPKSRSKRSIQRFSSMDKSILMEVVNILGGSYLSALSDFTGMNAQPSVPGLCVDMIGSILSIVAAEMGKTGDYALLFKSELFNNEERIIGDLFLLPDEKSCNNLFKSLGIV